MSRPDNAPKSNPWTRPLGAPPPADRPLTPAQKRRAAQAQLWTQPLPNAPTQVPSKETR